MDRVRLKRRPNSSIELINDYLSGLKLKRRPQQAPEQT